MNAETPTNERLTEMFLGEDQKVARMLGAKGFRVDEVKGPNGEKFFVAKVPP